ncbi:serine/threonine protein kinase [Mangrovibacillus cuniculi]|uniref:Protein kinase family protein n=1 Tax=Mangrovibacillus cuniculi TaxID=2593652 RepID=A0A7S8HH11_9BACI|nr:protein kinase family protein [Mangrovibacillus cuniculi]QPC47990.1 protein kinase family protein [Mangrovibacillus cuniculi]
MNPTWKKPFNIAVGTTIVGKWSGKSYTIVKELGYGANGIVYLATTANGEVALKMSDETLSVTSEVNVLKAFSKVQGSPLGPSLLEVDDWVTTRKTMPFYTMEYVKGPDYLSFIQQKGNSWIPVLIVQLLQDLHRLHEEGWVFGDLKPENLLVTGPPYRIRCIDVGGTTLQGRAIKEFTEFFDRGYWGMGSRKADRAYDLFAVAMIMINSYYPKRLTKVPNQNGVDVLYRAIRKQPELLPYEPILIKALKGDYQSAIEMRSALLHLPAKTQQVQKQRTNKPKPKQQLTKSKTASQSTHFFETVSLVFLVSMVYILYICFELLQ